jgi:sRNA-binding regulator protein Hfq
MTIQTTEDEFLDETVGQLVAVYILTGVKLTGHLIAHGPEVLVLGSGDGREGDLQMIFKSAVSTVVPQPANRMAAADAAKALLRRER